MNTRIVVAFMALVVLVGCVPGEAEFTFKTTDVRKALQGEVSQARVHEKMATTLSNAYDAVSFGGGRFTNRLDVVKALVKKTNGHRPFNLKADSWTNDTVRVWVEEHSGVLPCVRMEADICIALGRAEVLEKRTANQALGELFALRLDAETGRIDGFRQNEKNGPYNNRLLMFLSAVMARGELLEMLFGTQEKDLQSVDQSLFAVATPDWFEQLSVVVVGDSDEPLYVAAEDVRVNGKPMKRFEGPVKKGERVRFELIDKEKHKKDGGLRFFLKNPNTPVGVEAERQKHGYWRHGIGAECSTDMVILG